jgi:hypothetical protein
MRGVPKKVVERYHLDRFRQAYPDFPQGSIEESESPDFLVRTSEQTVGIEIVEYVRGQGVPGGSPQFKHETLGSRIGQRAATEFAAQSSLPVQVWFWLNHAAHLDKASAAALATGLADAVARSIPTATSGMTILEADDLQGTVLEGVMRRVRILRWPGADSSCWMYSGLVDYTGIAPEELQECIDRKDAKVDDYRSRCDRLWLLIVAAGRFSLAKTGSPILEVHEHTFRSRFVKVIFFDSESGKAFTLCVTARE